MEKAQAIESGKNETDLNLRRSILVSVVVVLAIGLVAAMFGNVGVPIICGALIVSVALRELGEDIVEALKKK